MKKSKLSLLVTLAVLSGGSYSAMSHAADTAFYQISEITSSSASNYGPWPTAMATDKSVASLTVTNDWFSYFNMAPMGMDLNERFRYELGCTSQMSSDMCSGFWDGGANRAEQWRKDTITYTNQATSLVNGSSQTEADGIVKGLGASSDEFVGYKIASSSENGYYYPRVGIATFSGVTTELAAPSSFSGVGSYSSANTLLDLGDGTYLVGGTANTDVAAPGSSLSYCYNGDTYKNGEYRYCPGFNTQAALWVVTPSATSETASLATSYYDADKNVIQTAAVTGLTKLSDGSYLAVGYSSTGKPGNSALSGRNVAVTWPVTVSNGTATFGTLAKVPLAKGEPAEGKKVLRNTWAVGTNGTYVIGNQKYNSSKSRNLPVEMFVYTVGSSDDAALPFADKPFNGSNSEAAAINANSQVVGWRDERSESHSVTNGSPRLQEAFLYNAATGNGWRLNDLICSGSTASASTCTQNGKFYYLVYASAIADDGTIAATAYRYDSYADWSARSNATVVQVKLTPATSFASTNDVPDGYTVTNALPASNVGQNNSNGGGAMPLWLLLSGLGMGVIRRFKKMS